MSLRRKLMMVLLLSSVLPMMAVRGVQAYSTYKLKNTVGADMRERLSAQAEQAMLQTVDGYAKSLDKVNRLGFALLRIQANEIELRITGPQPRRVVEVPTVEQFANVTNTGPQRWGIQNSNQHTIIGDDGQLIPLAISYQTQVVYSPTGYPLSNEQRADVDRLAGMSAVYQKIQAEADDVILWQYTALASGLHFSYPAKAVFPEGYTSLEQDWYRLAIAEEGATSIPPYLDASTRQLVVTFSQPVHFLGNGGLAGVTAMDLSVGRLLDPMALNTEWADEAKVIVVASYPPRRYTDQELDEVDTTPGQRPQRFERQPGRTGEDRARPNPARPSQPRDPRERTTAIDPGLSARGHDPDTRYPADVYIVADIQLDAGQEHDLTSLQTIGFDSPEDRALVTADLAEGKSAVRRVMIDGRDEMIAYGQIGGNEGRPLFTMIIAPTSTILAPAETAVTNVEEELEQSLLTTGLIVLGLLGLVGFVAFGLSHRLTRPITQMADASRRVAAGDLETRVELDRNDELGQLGDAFNQMVPALNDRMRIRESLAVAMQVQQSLLPNNAPSIPGLDIAGHSEYCDETGGDYYDFIELKQFGPKTLAIAVGDVTGHGIAAALLMATGRALIRSHANHPGTLSEVFSAVNHQLCDSEFTGRFMTLMYLIVDGRCDEGGCMPVRYLSAGHDPIIVYRPKQDRFIELAGNDIPLGIEGDWTFTEHQSDALRIGDILVAGTDGIWECFNADGEQFGKDRLREVIRANASDTAESISLAITKACRRWRGEREQTDDITMVVVKLAGEA